MSHKNNRQELFLLCCFIYILTASFHVFAKQLHVPTDSYPTIQSAIDLSHDQDHILIAPGVYIENLIINKAVTLLKDDNRKTGKVVINGGGQGRIIEIKASNVKISNLDITYSGDEVGNMDACIYVHKEARKIHISNNRLSRCAFGIWVNGSKQIILRGNTITGVKKKYFSDQGNGINIWSVEDAVVEYNDISNMRDGIYLTVTKNSAVRNNYLHNVRFGVHYMYNDDNVIIGNTTCDSMVGLAMMFSKRLKIIGNQAVNNKDHGILFRSIYDSEISNNIVSGNNKGLFLNDSSFNIISGNQVEGNAIGVHVTAGSEENKVTKNNFISNSVQVRYSWRFGQYWDDEGKGNYWSDYLGWDFDHNGTGDRTYFASNQIDKLIFKYPKIKLLSHSPIIQLMQSLESQFPILRPASVVDRHPAMKPFNMNSSININQSQADSICHLPKMNQS